MKIAVYGTLRKNQPNYERIRQKYGDNSLTYIKTTYVIGFGLYDLGLYPAAVTLDRRDHHSSRLTVNILEADVFAFTVINNMEVGAYYIPIIITLPKGTPTVMWIYDHVPRSNGKECPLIPSGDWVEHLKSKATP